MKPSKKLKHTSKPRNNNAKRHADFHSCSSQHAYPTLKLSCPTFAAWQRSRALSGATQWAARSQLRS
eukprot:2924837-Rhodomonas_salina.2